MIPGGQARSIAGVPPLTVVIGNASEVSATLRGQLARSRPRHAEERGAVRRRVTLPQRNRAMSEQTLIPRRHTRSADVAGVRIGGGAPIVVQSMTNTDTADVAATAAQVRALAEAGSELVRITVDTAAAAVAVPADPRRPRCRRLPRAADRRFPFQRAQAPRRTSGMRAGARQVPHQPGQCRQGIEARRPVRGDDRTGHPSTASRCASASTGAASTPTCSRG